MLIPFPQLLDAGAVGAFTCYDLETAGAVLDAAGAAGAGVVLLVSREAFAGPGGDELVVALRALADRATVPCCLQLDHVSDLALIRRALELGCGAVMADGSQLPFAANAQLVAGAVEIAERHEAHVEAELGHVAGDEDIAAAAREGRLTDPGEARRFVAETGAACLAVSIGNAHGVYAAGPPELDWTRLAAVRDATPVPLSLHGASGLPDDDVDRAVRSGIAKVNVNTELRAAYLDVTGRCLPRAVDGLRLLDLHREQRAAVRDVVARKLRLLGGVIA